MKHAVILLVAAQNCPEECFEVELADGKKAFLMETEYTQAELDEFSLEHGKWILQRKGSRSFLADSDSGEDAYGAYCNFFDLNLENAVFDNGRLAGFYLCPDDIRYSGNGRSSFSISGWGFPGYDPFRRAYYRNKTHVFLFSETDSHKWEEWTLLKRDPEGEYESYLDF